MATHFQFTDGEFAHKFKTCELQPDLFSHEAHLRLTYIHICKYGIERALVNIQHQLQNFVSHFGAVEKYNTTVTVAAIKAVYHFMLKSTSNNFKDFIEEFPRLNYNFKELMNAHYRFDIFNSTAAKVKFLEPDLLPFD